MLLAIRRHLLPLLAVALLVMVGGCARPPSIGITPLRPANLKDLQGYLLNHKADVEVFRLRGPFPVVVQEDHEIRVSAKERIEMDVYSPTLPEKAPLVIIVHGHDATKDDHGYQAMHLASWGLHAVTVQLPNTGPWVANGRMLAGIVSAIQRSPEIVDSRVDASRIILAGHSFGAVAVAVALAENPRVAGGILFDPARIGREVPDILKRIRKPVMVLGADERIFTARNRADFYRYIPGSIAEVSVRNADHDDAQFPADLSQQHPYATEEHQITFVSALTAAAFSLVLTGQFDYAWASLGGALEHGRFVDAKKK